MSKGDHSSHAADFTRALVQDAERARDAGCDAYVTKPIDTGVLPVVIADYVQTPRDQAL